MRRRKRSIFGKAKSKKLARIIKIDSPSHARKSVKTLTGLFRRASRKQKVKVKRATILAGIRARAFTKRRGVSLKERRQMRGVSRIYFNAGRRMRLKSK